MDFCNCLIYKGLYLVFLTKIIIGIFAYIK
nr:MAG TPA: hypothetical protein [Caudoviricetes sp.]